MALRTLSATCVAIALAHKAGSLALIERTSRLGGTFVALQDIHGVIEVQDDMAAAARRVQECAR